jgi:hypothetical protein
MALSIAERSRRYRLVHPDRVKTVQASYRAAHVAERAELDRRNKAADPDRRRAVVRESVRKWRAAHPETQAARLREQRYRREYGITIAQYDVMALLGHGACWVCGQKPKKKRLDVDHDHTTKRVRGLLCFICNRYRVGRTKSAQAPLYRRIAAYLESDFDGRKL